jgi:NitT/TauT family transport system permease protein
MTKPAPRTRELRGRRLAIVVGVVLILAWEGAVRLSLLPSIIIPTPSAILSTLGSSLAGGEMGANFRLTMLRLLAGLLLGGSIGLVVGLLMGWSRRLRGFFDPFVAVIHPLPKLALLPLLMVFFGLGEFPRVLVIAATSFFPMVLNAMAGVRQISPVHFDVARNHGASRWQVLRRVVIPGSLPMVLTGVRLAANLALITAVAVEMIAARSGLGAQLWLSWQVMRVDLLFATLFVIGAIGVVLNQGMRRVARRAAPWLSDRDLAI